MNRRAPRGLPTMERFMFYVDKTETCWLWTGGKSVEGYGNFAYDGTCWRAHRVAYTELVGAIPDGLVIDHICHVTSCVNPAHLRAVTHKQNLENQVSAHKGNRSGVRGVTWNKGVRKWCATVRHNGYNLHLGSFSTVGEAEKVVVEVRNRLFTHNDADRSAA